MRNLSFAVKVTTSSGSLLNVHMGSLFEVCADGLTVVSVDGFRLALELFADDDAHALKTLEHRFRVEDEVDGISARNGVFIVEELALEAAADELRLAHFK